MESVFLLQHLHRLSEDDDDVKVIGVYSSREAAERAVERLKAQPGFALHPRIVNALEDDEEEGFYINEYPLDKDFWEEGFITVFPGEAGNES